MNIYLIRHGRQNSKLCNVDVELSKEGRRQAKLTGERLKTYGIQAVYSSNLIRAKETADIINKYLDVERIVDDRFRESDFGEMTGLEDTVIKSRFADYLNRRSQMIEDLPYPGGENCEDVFKRTFEALSEVASKGYDNVAIVTHGGVLRALFTGIMGAPYKRWLSVGRQLENCGISEILYDKDKESFHIEKINDYSHIEPYDELLRKHFSTGYFKK